MNTHANDTAWLCGFSLIVTEGELIHFQTLIQLADNGLNSSDSKHFYNHAKVVHTTDQIITRLTRGQL